MGYYDMALTKEEQAAYDYAMKHSDMEGPAAVNAGDGRSMVS
jgi:hypothetical protein